MVYDILVGKGKVQWTKSKAQVSLSLHSSCFRYKRKILKKLFGCLFNVFEEAKLSLCWCFSMVSTYEWRIPFTKVEGRDRGRDRKGLGAGQGLWTSNSLLRIYPSEEPL